MPLFDKVQTDISSFDWSDINNPKQNEQTTPQGDSIFRGNLPDLETTGIRKKLEDREKDIDAQYEKFNGNKGLRTGNLGFDEPFIVKDVGDRYLREWQSYSAKHSTLKDFHFTRNIHSHTENCKFAQIVG